jgi:hypothetical protein
MRLEEQLQLVPVLVRLVVVTSKSMLVRQNAAMVAD